MGVAVPVIALIFASLGIVFGALEVATVAFATERGIAVTSGVLLAVFSAGSMIGGLTFGTRVGGRNLPRQLVVVLGLGVITGALNGLLVEVARIDSFIATLGTGTVLYALALWHTGGHQMVGVLPNAFYAINGTFVLGLPITAYYVVAITLALWVVLDYTPTGRYLYAIGANQRAAELNGIPTRKFVIGAFVSSGFLTALAGVILASKLRIGQASVGLEFLLPALVGAFLGSTTIKPGRVNVWGTIVGVMILAVGISGIQQFGGSFWVEPLFNGTTLLIAIGIAGYAQRKKGAKTT
jgi:ribose transport system permease protein